MDTEKFKVKLNSPENVYYAGQEIRGQITIVLTKKTKIRGISYRLLGYGKCSWVEFLKRESQVNTVKEQRSMAYTSREEYVRHADYILGSKTAKPTEFEAGTHNFEFVCNLDTYLPSTFKGKYGSIKYKIGIVLEKPWSFDEKYTLPITVVKALQTYPSQEPAFQQMTRNIGVFSGGPISLVAELPNCNSVRGEKLKLCVTVDNKSSTPVDRLKFSIKQYVTYFSQHPIPFVKREEVIKIYKKETGSIEKKSQRSFEHELQIPYCQPSDNDLAKIICIEYKVQVDAVLPGLYKNITIILPMVICSHSAIANMNTSSIGWVQQYPRLDKTILSMDDSMHSTTSPSHSIASSNNSSFSEGVGLAGSPQRFPSIITNDRPPSYTPSESSSSPSRLSVISTDSYVFPHQMLELARASTLTTVSTDSPAYVLASADFASESPPSPRLSLANVDDLLPTFSQSRVLQPAYELASADFASESPPSPRLSLANVDNLLPTFSQSRVLRLGAEEIARERRLSREVPLPSFLSASARHSHHPIESPPPPSYEDLFGSTSSSTPGNVPSAPPIYSIKQ